MRHYAALLQVLFQIMPNHRLEEGYSIIAELCAKNRIELGKLKSTRSAQIKSQTFLERISPLLTGKRSVYLVAIEERISELEGDVATETLALDIFRSEMRARNILFVV